MDKLAEIILNTVDVHVIAGIGMLILSAVCIWALWILFNQQNAELRVVFKLDYRDMGHKNLMPHHYMDFEEASEAIRENLVTDINGDMVENSKITIYHRLKDTNTDKYSSDLHKTDFVKVPTEELINYLESIVLKMELKDESENN